MKQKRRSRTKLSKNTDIDIMKPLDLGLIGTTEDPCFGKLNDPAAEECNRCGDCELCSIVQAQNLHLRRKSTEDKQAFKDIQTLSLSWKVVLKTMKKILPTGSLSHPLIKDKVVKKLHTTEGEYDKVYKTLIKKKVFKKYFIIKNSLIKRLP